MDLLTMSPIAPVESTFKSDILGQWQAIESRLQKAMDQLDILSDRIYDLKMRLKRATELNHQGALQSLSLQLQVVQGVQTAYYAYADRKAEEMNNLWQEMSKLPDFDEIDFGEELEMDLHESID